MDDLPDTIANAVDALFDAAILRLDWPTALDGLAAALGAAGAAVVPRETTLFAADLPTSHSLVDVMKAYVGGGWHLRDVRNTRSWQVLGDGRGVVTEHDITTDDERRRLVAFNEFYLPAGLPWFGAIAFNSEGHDFSLTLLRGAGQGPYEASEMRGYAALIPHLRRIVSLAYRFNAERDAQLISTLSLLGHNSILLDSRGGVLASSEGAGALLGGGLGIVQGRLQAQQPDDDRDLQQLIASALAAGRPASQTGRPLAVVRRPAGRPLVVDVISLPRVARDLFSRAVALVTLRDLDALADPADASLRQVFGLTPAEAAVARHLLRGDTPQDIADLLGKDVETVRTLLKRVFSKTDVHRQSELVALLSRLPVQMH